MTLFPEGANNEPLHRKAIFLGTPQQQQSKFAVSEYMRNLLKHQLTQPFYVKNVGGV
ncbi:MAG: hypothetical protein ACI3X6_06430 [Alloprevotella sp.]